jgi:glycosyltransferase involved in cell wall biosynthesis
MPILPAAEQNASKIKNYYTWASFAEKGLKALGHDHAKTLRGSLDTSTFHRLDDESRSKLREVFKINKDEFIIGFVFRNQLRKSVPNLLDGFKLFKKNNPQSKAKLLLHTHWGEGWDIPRLLKEKSIDNSDILTTYFCPKCAQYEIKSFAGQEQDCRFCGSKKSQNTTNVGSGVDEDQLNQIYNLMDVYCHPFTSGGQEIPVQEAKLAELITLVTNYSCGEDCCTAESGGLPLEWAEYREPGTQFIKASTYPASIAKQLNKVFKMKGDRRRLLEKKSRDYVINNYSIEVIGKQLEEIFDAMPHCEWDFDFSEKPRNPSYNPPPIKDDKEWLKDIYKNMLTMEVDGEDDGLKYWLNEFEKNVSRENVLNYFRKIAADENQKNQKTDLGDLLDKDDEGKRILYVIPQSAGDVFMSTSLFPSIKRIYPEYNLYVATDPKFQSILDGNEHIHKALPYVQGMDDLLAMEGRGEHKGYFDITFLPHVGTQKIFNYQHNAKDKIEFELCTS